MTKKPHKIIIFQRGGLMNCYLDMPMEECKRRQAEYEKDRSPIHAAQEDKYPLQIIEYEFTDHFQIWGNIQNELKEILGNIF